MNRRQLLGLLGLAFTASACSDAASLVTASPAEAPSFVTVVNGPGDDTQAIQAAVNLGGNVYLPAGQWTVSGTIEVGSNTRIYGDGRSLSVITTTNTNPEHMIFLTREGRKNVTIENLGFVGPGVFHQFAFRVKAADSIVFQNNSAEKIGLLATTPNHPDPNNIGADLTGKLATNLKVLNNIGVGPCGRLYRTDKNCHEVGADRFEGIFMHYAQGVEVRGNTLSRYTSGIQWWGGNAELTPNRKRWAGDMTISNNNVNHTINGIWGSMGFNIDVIGNDVNHCTDVCLDDEGGYDVLFYENHARFGRYVLATFHRSQQAQFVWNYAEQNGTYIDQNLIPRTTCAPGFPANGEPCHVLFRLANGLKMDSVDVRMHNNTFEWKGVTGAGKIYKEYSAYVQFANNTLKNVVVDFDMFNQPGMVPMGDMGGVQITGNSLTFDRCLPSGQAAIRAGDNHWKANTQAWPVNGTFHLEIGGNTIRSTVWQSGYGIQVRQTSNSNAPVNSYIHRNDVRDFGRVLSWPRSIYGEGGGWHHHFNVQFNQTSRPVLISNTSNVLLHQNTTVGNTYTNGVCA